MYTYLLRTQYLWWFMWVIRVDVECKLELTAFVHSCKSVYALFPPRLELLRAGVDAYAEEDEVLGRDMTYLHQE